MSKRLLDYDPLTATQVWHDYDEVNNITTIAEIQDVEPSLELSKSFRHADIKGGINAGIDTCWLNRHGAARPEGITPHIEVSSLAQLQQWLLGDSA